MSAFHRLRVLSNDSCAEDARRIHLDIPQHLTAEFAGDGGQHIVLRTSINNTEHRRTYSLINAAGTTPLQIGVRVHPQGEMSQWLAKLDVGAAVDVMAPLGSFMGAEQDKAPKNIVCLAAGCGITPILGILNTQFAQQPLTQARLLYGNQRLARTLFVEDILGLKNRFMSGLALHFIMSREPQELQAHEGRVDADKLRWFTENVFDPTQVDAFYLCGPGTMNTDLQHLLVQLGIAKKRIHCEFFTTESTTTQPPPAVPSPANTNAPGTRVSVVMDGRERSFTINDPQDTVLDAGLEAGIDLPYSCCGGVCSTCRVRVLEGHVEMADNYALEDWELEQGYVLACQAHATTATLALSYDER